MEWAGCQGRRSVGRGLYRRAESEQGPWQGPALSLTLHPLSFQRGVRNMQDLWFGIAPRGNLSPRVLVTAPTPGDCTSRSTLPRRKPGPGYPGIPALRTLGIKRCTLCIIDTRAPHKVVHKNDCPVSTEGGKNPRG